MPPKFSIIIPVYNVAPYLRECLDSVLSLTIEDWEAICVDDGSTDESGDILDAYSVRDSRIKVIHQTNAGVSMARQCGMDVATGLYLLWIDADDKIEVAEFEKFMLYGLKSGADLIWCDCIEEDESGLRHYACQKVETSSQVLAEAILRGSVWASLWNKMISLDFIRRNHVTFDPQAIVMEDVLFMVELLAAKPILKYCACAYYHYQIHSSSLMHRTWNDARAIGFAYVEQEIKRHAPVELDADILTRRQQQLKFWIYQTSSISSEVFSTIFPSIRNLSLLSVQWWHRILFFIASFISRNLVLKLLFWVRKFRSMA